MFKNLLVGVDGQQGGRDAIALAARLAAKDATITLLHVHSTDTRPITAFVPDIAEEECALSHSLLEGERAKAAIEANLVSCPAATVGKGLHQQADEQKADLLLVGSSSRGLFGRAMLGDDTRAALNGAPCAVAIAARGFAEHGHELSRVGVAYNASPESQAALVLARELAQLSGAPVQALYVVLWPAYAFTGMWPPLLGDSVAMMITEAEDDMKGLEGVEGHAVYGLAGEELAAFSDRLDILVVGSRSYGPWGRLVHGSTSEYLERHARSSLVILPRAVSPESDARAGTQTATAAV